jgi:hypothetical protein
MQAGMGPVAPQATEDVRYIDANVDRYIISSTAETHPEGTFYFTDYELFLLQFGYAVTDQIQLSLTGVPPLLEDQPYFFDLATKINVVRSQFRFALIGALDLLFVDDETFWGARIGGAGTVCFTGDCWSHASLNGTVFFNDQISDFLPLTFGVGVLGRVSDLIGFVGEGLFTAAIGDGGGVADGMILNYGVRISGRQFGIDVGFLKFIPFEDDFDDPFILGFPLVSFTYRTEGNVASPSTAAGPATIQTSDMMRRAVVGF